jgi:hypothetical protein
MFTVLALESCVPSLSQENVYSVRQNRAAFGNASWQKARIPSHIHHPLLSTSMRSNAVQLKLNDDILQHIATFIPPDTLARLSSVTPVFFHEHMKNVYTSLSFIKRDRQMKKLLSHLA